jgi:hypothetical protein
MKGLSTSARAGFGRGSVFLFIVVLAMLAFGGQQLYTWNRNRQVTSLTYAEWVKAKPDADWIELKGAYLDFTSAAYEGTETNVKSLYVSVIPAPPTLGLGKQSEPAQLLLHTTDPKHIAFFKEINAVTEAQVAGFVLKNQDRIWPKTDVRGIMEFGMESNSTHRTQLQKLQGLKVAPNFAVMKDGAEPNLALGAGLCVGGLLIGFFLLKRRNA